MTMQIKKIKVERKRFSSRRDMDTYHPVDEQIEEYLQQLLVLGHELVSVQQTHVQHITPGATDTYISWVEMLIISTVTIEY